jgi:hypothetical protein
MCAQSSNKLQFKDPSDEKCGQKGGFPLPTAQNKGYILPVLGLFGCIAFSLGL